MDKTKIIRLKQGSTAVLDGVSLGYTKGIEVEIARSYNPLYNQKTIGAVGYEGIDKSAKISVSLLEYSTASDDLIFGDLSGTPTYSTLVITGKTMAGNDKVFTFLRVFREDVDSFPLNKNETVFKITFRAIPDLTTGKVLTYTGGD